MKHLEEAIHWYFEDGGGYDVEDFLHAYGDPRQALLLFRLFYPEFVSVDEHVVLKRSIQAPEEPERLLKRLREEPTQAQATLAGYRWDEIRYLFDERPLVDDDEELLASLVSQSWKAALLAQFPGKAWTTRVIPPEETGDSWGVGFTESSTGSQ